MSESNLIKIGNWKNQVESKKEQDSIGEYLTVLTASELIKESQLLIAEIQNGNVTAEITNRYQKITSEFKKRVQANSPSKAMAIQEQGLETSKKIASFL